LLRWSHFDPYYFDRLRKLDRKMADRNLQHLRQLQEIRDARTRDEREHREKRESELQKPHSTLPELREKFLELHAGGLKPQERGYVLESILLELCRLSKLEVTEPFRVRGEQIDGAAKFEGEHYIIEAKWQDKASSNEPVYQFAGKVDGKMYGRGLFISVQGYSEHVVRDLTTGKAVRTILIDGADVVLVLEEHLTFAKLLDRKVKAAQTKGLIYVHPITGEPKVH
jgi:hypothetical protein